MPVAAMRKVPITFAILALLAVLLVVRVPGKGVWHEVLLNAVHGPIFALVAVLLLVLIERKVPERLAAFATAFLLSVVLGILIEIVQSFANRPGSVFDVLTDAAGAAAGLAAWVLFTASRSGAFQLNRVSTLPRKPPHAAWLPIAIALAGVTFIAWAPLQAARAYAHRAAVFPSIAEFRGAQDLVFVSTDGTQVAIEPLPEPWGRGADDLGLRIAYDAQHSPAVQVVEPVRDWRGYSVIAVDITNPASTQLGLTFRILDARHDWSHADRLNLPLVVPPQTRTTVRVALSAVEAAPAGRYMDMSRIANVMLFGRAVAGPAESPAEFYVSRIWLE